MATFGRNFGLECYMVGPSEVKKMNPLLDTTQIANALYNPNGGSMEPAGVCEALTRAAVRAGAKVVEDCRVTAISTQETLLGGRRVTEVHTQRGNINTSAVINATGAWANDICGLVGVHVPQQVFKHWYVGTGSMAGLEGVVPVTRNYSASCYYKPQGDSLVIGGFETNPIPIDKPSPDFHFGMYEPDWEHFSGFLEKAAKVVPAIESAGIKSTVHGLESFTPDNKPILGEDANVQGFYHCTGFSSHGMQMSGGCGQQMAHWVVEGRPTIDMFTYDVRRLNPGLTRDQGWVLNRSGDKYSKNYSIAFPHDESLFCRGKRLSPLHQELEAGGCVFQERQGMERPGWFHSHPVPLPLQDSVDTRYEEVLKLDYTFDLPAHFETLRQECLSCRKHAAVFDLTSFGKFLMTGRDAEAAADWLFSADVTAKAPGATVYTCMLNSRAGVEADLTVSVCEAGEGLPNAPQFEGRGFYLTTGGPTAEYCRAHVVCEARRRGWQVHVADLSEELAILSVQGPNSRAILRKLTSDSLDDASFPLYSHRVITVASHRLHAIRLSFVGELGWELHIPRASAVEVYRAVKEAGRDVGLVDAGFRAMESLSCEKGYRHWHADLRLDDTPLEAGLAFTCKLKTDTDFLGRKALEEQKAKGVRRRLVTLTLQDHQHPLWGQEVIKRDGHVVGYVRCAQHAFTLGQVIAYGYVQQPDGGPVTRDFLSTGDWQVEARLKHLPVTLNLTHPFDPQNLRLKGIYSDQATVP
ncbi:hypothetical protein Pcinc_032521 [Petrolisthes cinctipes]|uniref:Sarcosine dehydrogenase n=1 Tax=Petrolisthes cinctipes TaxID=88211 RepID=A0AAE1K2W3_PETCI|nr:hypothetical protein Pcinc_032521 [Petrolisthes cinctipes]